MSNPTPPPQPPRNPDYPPSYPAAYPGEYPGTLAGGSGSLDLLKIWFVVLEKLWLVGTVLAIFLALAVVYVVTAQRIYEGTATVQVESQDTTTVGKDQASSVLNSQTEQEVLNTIVEKFQSRPLCALVLAQVGLISSNSLDAIIALGNQDTDETSGGASVGKGAIAASPTTLSNGVAIAPAAGSNNATGVPSSAEIQASLLSSDIFTPEVMKDLKTVGGFSKGGLVVKLRRNTRLIDVTVRHQDPNLAAKMANLMVQLYLTRDFNIKSTTGHSQSELFEVEAKHLEKKLQESEQELQDYRTQVGTVELGGLNSIASGGVANSSSVDEIEEYKRQLTEAQAESIRLKAAYEKSLEMGTNVDELLAYTAISSDPQVQLIQTAVAQKEADFLQIKQLYREKNPKYVLAKQTLEGLRIQLTNTVFNIRSRIQESFRLPYENSLTTQHGLEKELARVQTKGLDLSQKAIHYNLLARQVAADQAMFDAVLQKLHEASVNSDLEPVNISLVEAAYPADKPSSPKVTLALVAALFGGLFCGVGLVLFIDQFNTSLRTVDGAEEFLQQPVLGAIPRLTIDTSNPANSLVMASGGAHSAEVELFRTLRAAVTLLDHQKEHRVFMFTSSFPKEGKTFTSGNFATSLAQQGLRVVVLDFDLRRPRLEEFLTGTQKHIPGVTEVLEGKKKLDEVVQKHPLVENLWWVGAGTIIPNPAELLSQGVAKKLIDEALAKYDRVVIDTPPLHPVKDALVVAELANVVILMVDGSKTARKAAAKSIHWLKNIEAPLAGVVLNFLPRKRTGQGYYYYEYYGYSYGKYGDDKKKEKKSSASKK